MVTATIRTNLMWGKFLLSHYAAEAFDGLNVDCLGFSTFFS